MLAGAALWLCMLKPHLFLPMGVVLVLWSRETRRLRVSLGLAASLVATTAAVMVLDRHVWEHYLALSEKLLADFGAELGHLAGREQFFARRLYAPEYPPHGISQTEVYPPE